MKYSATVSVSLRATHHALEVKTRSITILACVHQNDLVIACLDQLDNAQDLPSRYPVE